MVGQKRIFMISVYYYPSINILNDATFDKKSIFCY